MRNSHWFRIFGIEPRFMPDTKDVEGFIWDEVVRQGHDPRIEEDGGIRCEWMQEAWDFAVENASEKPQVAHIERIGTILEQGHNVGGFRDYNNANVFIGDHKAPDSHFVRGLIHDLFSVVDQIQPLTDLIVNGAWKSYTVGGFSDEISALETADDFYLAFEWIHPFRDGNGRTGKILHNWLMHTLNDPILIADYFQMGNP